MNGNAGDVQAFYGRWARLYDLIARAPGVGAWRANATAALGLDPGETVVEMGCGTGANLPYLRERVGSRGRVIGIDLTEGMLNVARERIVDQGWENVSVLRADAARPPLTNVGIDPAAIDGVLASFVSGMFADPQPVVDRWCSLLAPGGRICLLDATRSSRLLARPLDLAFRAFVVASTPPTRKLRYENPPWKPLESRVAAAHETVRNQSSAYHTERFALGFVRLSAGVIE
jgi:phosphatidylethanolamine/phosphatidyl-N-methylethanolamine N-methyltransferase